MQPAREPLCPTCLTPLAREHRFCPTCGGERQASPPARRRYSELQDPAKARVTVLRGGGLDGASFFLNREKQTLGRAGDVRLEDAFLAPIHGTFAYVDGKLLASPVDSANGMYRRIHGATEVTMGEMFLAGESVFRVVPAQHPERVPAPDGTVPLASDAGTSSFGVVQMLAGGAPGLAYFSRGASLTVGQEGCDVNLANDPFLARSHCSLGAEGGSLILMDLDTENGTYVRFTEPREVVHGDYLVAGRCVLRVEFNG